MGREAWINLICRFACYTGAAFAIVLDASMSYAYIASKIGISDLQIKHNIALALCYVIAVLASSVGGMCWAPYSWDFLFEIPEELAKITNKAQRVSRMFGYAIASVFCVGIVVGAYWIDLVSTAASVAGTDKASSWLIAIIIVFSSDACLFFARVCKRMGKASLKAEGDYDLKVYGSRQVGRTTNVGASRIE